MKLVVGLGNPGREYAGTRHNIGFAVVDRLAGRLDCSLKSSLRFQARIGKTRRGDNELWLVEPDTFMNRSGDAVGAILRYMKVAVEDLRVTEAVAGAAPTMKRFLPRAQGRATPLLKRSAHITITVGDGKK